MLKTTSLRTLSLALVCAGFLVAACDGGPPGGRLTLSNESDRPVMWLSDTTYEAALRDARWVQSNAVIEPGDRTTVSYGRPINVSNDEPWCMNSQYWVITSKTDNVEDFEPPIDPDSVNAEQHLVNQCWDGRSDSYVIE